MTEEQFWALVDKTEPPHPRLGTPCWVWQGYLNGWGYGEAQFNKKRWRAHRLAWTLINGEIPDNRMACHKCDRPRCVNPDHIFIGTNADNIKDAFMKHRIPRPVRMSTEEKEARRKYLQLCRISSVKYN